MPSFHHAIVCLHRRLPRALSLVLLGEVVRNNPAAPTLVLHGSRHIVGLLHGPERFSDAGRGYLVKCGARLALRPRYLSWLVLVLLLKEASNSRDGVLLVWRGHGDLPVISSDLGAAVAVALRVGWQLLVVARASPTRCRITFRELASWRTIQVDIKVERPGVLGHSSLIMSLCIALLCRCRLRNKPTLILCQIRAAIERPADPVRARLLMVTLC